MKNLSSFLAAFAGLLLFVPAASADWSDNFDSYSVGDGLHEMGGWAGWENNPAYDAYVTDVQAYSSPNSAAIHPTSDIVQDFDDYLTGEYEMTAWCYVPGGATGSQYFIMLNKYHPDSTGSAAWSVQLQLDSDAGEVIEYYSGSTVPIVNDSWVEVTVEIYLDLNTYSIYYDGGFLASNDWFGTGGKAEIAALDLFSDGGSTIFWDDCELVQTAIGLEQTTWGSIKTIME